MIKDDKATALKADVAALKDDVAALRTEVDSFAEDMARWFDALARESDEYKEEIISHFYATVMEIRQERVSRLRKSRQHRSL